MVGHPGFPSVSPPPRVRMEAAGACARTCPAVGSSSDRRPAATGLPRSARSAGLALLALAALAVAGCDPYVEGNGVYLEEDRTPTQTVFGVHVQDGIQATVASAAAQQKVVVSGDANIVKDYVKTEVVADQGSGPVLHVRLASGHPTLDPALPLRAVIQLAELRSVEADGDSHVSASAVATQLLSLEASGKSSVVVMGAGGARVEVSVADAAVDAGAYPVSEGALVAVSGGGRVEVHSDGPVAGTVATGSTLENFGAGTCAGVTADAGATLLCPVP